MSKSEIEVSINTHQWLVSRNGKLKLKLSKNRDGLIEVIKKYINIVEALI